MPPDPLLSINGDRHVRVHIDSTAMPWQESPSRGVWRKRFHLVGSAEQGQVTSLVRFAPGSHFPLHPHPEGEEILILKGVFSDHTGDWGHGSFLLNPEGFEHAPFTEEGCTLFVKLRQAPGRQRPHITCDTQSLDWEKQADGGISRITLSAWPGAPETIHLEKWHLGYTSQSITHPAGIEILTLSGQWRDEHATYRKGHWLRLPPGASHTPRCEDETLVYIKRGGVAYLREGS